MSHSSLILSLFFFNGTATTEIYTLSLHDALPISGGGGGARGARRAVGAVLHPVRIAGREALLRGAGLPRSEEHTSELQSRGHLVCRLLLEKKKHNERAKNMTTHPSIEHVCLC